MAGSVVALKRQSESIEVTSTEQACGILQRDLVQYCRAHGRDWNHRLVEATELSHHTIRRILYGETMSPRHRTINRLASALGWSIWWTR